MLYIAVSVMFANHIAKLVIVEKFNQLGENVFIFVHRAASMITAKVQIQIVAPLKYLAKGCISIKKLLVHFNGTVVL